MNLRDAALELDDDLPAGFRFREAQVGEAIGGAEIGCSLYGVPPGEQLWPYHWHENNDEWALVVAGAPTLRTPEGERVLRAGDVVAFPEGEAGAHTFTNTGDEEARIAIFSTQRPGACVYPDSDKIAAGPRPLRRTYRLADAVGYWDGEGA